MVEESLHLQGDRNVEYYLVTMLEKLETIRQEANNVVNNHKVPIQVEIRTLEFWRSVFSECLASFIYVFVVCGATSGAAVGTPISSLLITSLASGFVMTALTQCFGHISGAHVNPSVSIALGVIRRISLLRTMLFILAQCGGGIAGAAFLYRVTVPTFQGNLAATIGISVNVNPWEKFGIEFILTFIVVFSYIVSMDTYRKWIGTSSLTIGSAYSACSFVSMPYLNPARSLGPSFVLNKWENHWVYWLGPVLGGIASALTYEYIFNPNSQKNIGKSQDDESSSIISDDIDTYDDLDKPTPTTCQESTYNNYRPAASDAYCASIYSAPPTKLERGESIYGGTRSLYCISPRLTRANLNRSQSVYAKSNTGINKDAIPKPGPLVPTKSMYPLRLNQLNHIQNQNVQNQLQQKSEGIYNARSINTPTVNRTESLGAADRQRNCSTAERSKPDNYSTMERKRGDNFGIIENPYGRNNPSSSESSGKFKDNVKSSHENRPESTYGMLGWRIPSAQTEDTNNGYNFYGGVNNVRNTNPTNSLYHNSKNPVCYPQKPRCGGYPGLSETKSAGSESKPNQSTQLLANSIPSSYHHQHSPNPQY